MLGLENIAIANKNSSPDGDGQYMKASMLLRSCLPKFWILGLNVPMRLILLRHLQSKHFSGEHDLFMKYGYRAGGFFRKSFTYAT